MCTAVSYTPRGRAGGHFLGRNLDLWFSYGEKVAVIPRRFPFSFADTVKGPFLLQNHYAMIGMAHTAEGYPLYYDAMNEKGLAVAGLHFPGSGVYLPAAEGWDNIPSYGWIPWVLGQCADTAEAEQLLQRTRILGEPFRESLPPMPLHWMVADRERCIVVEPRENGVRIYEDPVGVLTNSPPFPWHMAKLSELLPLSPYPPENRTGIGTLEPHSQGMGAVGLPGDFSSSSRFLRSAFVRANALPGETVGENVEQFFHILGSVAQYKGCVMVPEGNSFLPEYTQYSCCCDTERGVYYYRRYEDSRIRAVSLQDFDLSGDRMMTVEEPKVWNR